MLNEMLLLVNLKYVDGEVGHVILKTDEEHIEAVKDIVNKAYARWQKDDTALTKTDVLTPSIEEYIDEEVKRAGIKVQYVTYEETNLYI